MVQENPRERFIDNLLVRIHVAIVIIWWTGLAPWEFEFPFPGSLTSTSLSGEPGYGSGEASFQSLATVSPRALQTIIN